MKSKVYRIRKNAKKALKRKIDRHKMKESNEYKEKRKQREKEYRKRKN